MEAWWVANRPKAPTLFTDELEATFRLLCELRNAGVGWPTTRRPELRRLLMPETKNHVYFMVNEKTQTVHVLSVWGGPRGTTPRL
jgi:plasmid stabilization system protein ParE